MASPKINDYERSEFAVSRAWHYVRYIYVFQIVSVVKNFFYGGTDFCS